MSFADVEVSIEVATALSATLQLTCTGHAERPFPLEAVNRLLLFCSSISVIFRLSCLRRSLHDALKGHAPSLWDYLFRDLVEGLDVPGCLSHAHLRASLAHLQHPPCWRLMAQPHVDLLPEASRVSSPRAGPASRVEASQDRVVQARRAWLQASSRELIVQFLSQPFHWASGWQSGYVIVKVECEKGTLDDIYGNEGSDSEEETASVQPGEEKLLVPSLLSRCQPFGSCVLGGYRYVVVMQPTIESITSCPVTQGCSYQSNFILFSVPLRSQTEEAAVGLTVGGLSEKAAKVFVASRLGATLGMQKVTYMYDVPGNWDATTHVGLALSLTFDTLIVFHNRVPVLRLFAHGKALFCPCPVHSLSQSKSTSTECLCLRFALMRQCVEYDMGPVDGYIERRSSASDLLLESAIAVTWKPLDEAPPLYSEWPWETKAIAVSTKELLIEVNEAVTERPYVACMVEQERRANRTRSESKDQT